MDIDINNILNNLFDIKAELHLEKCLETKYNKTFEYDEKLKLVIEIILKKDSAIK